MDGCVPIAYLVWAQGDTNSHSGFHHTAYMMWAQEATCMNAVCMNIMKTNICTISASVFVSSATKVSRRTNQAQTVSKWNGRRCLSMSTQPQRMLSLLPHWISVLLHQRHRKQMEKRITQAHDRAKENSDREHRWIRDKHASATHTEKSHAASETFAETRSFECCMITSADGFYIPQSSRPEYADWSTSPT